MRISGELDLGSMLYEDRVCSVAACRNYMGDFFEEATAKLMNGVRLKTDSQKDVCPDIRVNHFLYLESKSIGCSNSVIAYENRLIKDADFMASRAFNFWYVLWRHEAKIYDKIRLGQLRDDAAKLVRAVVIVDAADFNRLIRTTAKRTLCKKNTQRGYGSHGYNDGFQIPYTRFREIAPANPGPQLEVYGRVLAPFDMHFIPAGSIT